MMPDPMSIMQNYIGQFRNFVQNPVQFMTSRKLNLPQNWMQDPNGAIQQMMNSGTMTQQQYNNLNQMAQNLMKQPQFQQMMGGKR